MQSLLRKRKPYRTRESRTKEGEDDANQEKRALAAGSGTKKTNTNRGKLCSRKSHTTLTDPQSVYILYNWFRIEGFDIAILNFEYRMADIYCTCPVATFTYETHPFKSEALVGHVIQLRSHNWSNNTTTVYHK